MSRPGVDHKLCHYIDGQERQKTQEPLVAALGCFAVVAKKPTTVSGLLIELITYIEREMIGRKERGREAKRGLIWNLVIFGTFHNDCDGGR